MAAGQRVRVEALVVRLDPTRAQRDELMRWAGARRVAFNWALDMIRVNQAIWAAQRALEIPARERVRPFSFFDLDGLWRNVYRADVAPWHGEVAAVVFTFAIRDAVEAHKRFLSGTARFPHYRSRRKNRPVATVRAARLEARAVVLPRIGSVKICSADPAQARLRRLIRRGRARLLNVTVSRHADGRWYASLAVERQIIHQAGDAVRMLGPIVGADVGVKSLVVAATSDAKLFDEAHGVKHLRQAQRRLRHAQRAVSRKDRAAAGPGATRITASTSAQRAKAVARLARAHAQVSRRRADGTNVLSKKLATSAGVIVVEDLAVRSMMASGGSHKRGLNRAIADAGFGEIRRQLVYKTVRHGSVLVAADRWFSSSKRCARCGWVRAKLTLAERHYACANPACGHRADRDLNAATNLAIWGEGVVLARGLGAIFPAPTQVGAPDQPEPRTTRRGSKAKPRSSARGGGRSGAQLAPVTPDEAGTCQPLVA